MIPPCPPALSRPDQDSASCVPVERARIYYPPIKVPHKHAARFSKGAQRWPAREWPAWTDAEHYAPMPEDPALWPDWCDERWTASRKAVAQ
jgi:hypothetical protein